MDQPGDWNSESKRRLAAFLKRIWSQGDVDAVDDFIAERYTIYSDSGDPWDGQTLDRDGFRDRLTRSRAMALDQVFTPVEMIEEGKRIAVSWTWEGTHTGDAPGLPASGKRITMTGMTIYHFEADRLCGHWQIADRLGVYRQIMGQG